MPASTNVGMLGQKKPGPQWARVLNAPGETRTPNLLIRSQMLYPIELRAHLWLRTKSVFQSSASPMGGTRLELVTSTMSTWRSNQLS
jgi:hypothetical protein